MWSTLQPFARHLTEQQRAIMKQHQMILRRAANPPLIDPTVSRILRDQMSPIGPTFRMLLAQPQIMRQLSTNAIFRQVYFGTGYGTTAPQTATPAPQPTAAPVAPTYGWTQRFREAMSRPELSDEEKNNLVRSMLLALVVPAYVAADMYPQVDHEMARIGLFAWIVTWLYELLRF
jgi:hypothetical protein